MKTFILFSLASTLAVNSFAQEDDSAMVKRIVDETMTNATAYTNLKRICKEVGPRL